METPARRTPVLDMSPEDFRSLGHMVVDELAAFLARMPGRPVTPGESPAEVRAVFGGQPLPREGAEPGALLREAMRLMEAHSLSNGHPRFLGYVTSSAAPLGALADLIASTFNPNTGAWILSPAASEIEAQAVRWIAGFLGYPDDCGGLLVSGGNMANFVGFLAARKAKADWDVRAEGVKEGRLRVYASRETHTWIQKAADLSGLGTNAIRWIPVTPDQRMDVAALLNAIEEDRRAGARPFLVVGSAGTVGTGAVDPLREIAAIARQYGLWFHVDGAYGAPAAALPDACDDLKALALADSLAVDPHKWLYAPLEAGCALVREASRLRETFDYSPAYYRFDDGGEEKPLNYYALGPQNSRGFRALKVWLGLRAAGRDGLVKLIGEDIALARALFEEAARTPSIEVLTNSLSITTFRYVPAGLDPAGAADAEYLNRLNEELLSRIQRGGEMFLSNAIVDGKFALRACVVNFRTTIDDVRAIPKLIAGMGAEIHARLR